MDISLVFDGVEVFKRNTSQQALLPVHIYFAQLGGNIMMHSPGLDMYIVTWKVDCVLVPLREAPADAEAAFKETLEEVLAKQAPHAVVSMASLRDCLPPVWKAPTCAELKQQFPVTQLFTQVVLSGQELAALKAGGHAATADRMLALLRRMVNEIVRYVQPYWHGERDWFATGGLVWSLPLKGTGLTLEAFNGVLKKAFLPVIKDQLEDSITIMKKVGG